MQSLSSLDVCRSAATGWCHALHTHIPTNGACQQRVLAAHAAHTPQQLWPHSGQTSIATGQPQCCSSHALGFAPLCRRNWGRPCCSLSFGCQPDSAFGSVSVCGCRSSPTAGASLFGCLGAHQGRPRSLPIRLHITSHSHSKHAQKPRESCVVAHTTSGRCEEPRH